MHRSQFSGQGANLATMAAILEQQQCRCPDSILDAQLWHALHDNLHYAIQPSATLCRCAVHHVPQCFCIEAVMACIL